MRKPTKTDIKYCRYTDSFRKPNDFRQLHFLDDHYFVRRYDNHIGLIFIDGNFPFIEDSDYNNLGECISIHSDRRQPWEIASLFFDDMLDNLGISTNILKTSKVLRFYQNLIISIATIHREKD